MDDQTAAADDLSSASARGDAAEVERMLRGGADVNGRNRFGRTPIQVMKLGCPAVAELLLLRGADADVRDPVAGLTVAHDAARDGHADTLRVLVGHKADVNVADVHGNLPLHLAAQEGHARAVRVLLGPTAAPGARNKRGHTPRDLAEMNGRDEVLRVMDGVREDVAGN
ncbi:cyclin-dependent kinase 4 inhibitor C [Denticeps clupeoides]|uniref:Uncharacterized protein n=1 Tax=Denticeps clupeoides TaxID=299321 RepID=A0AAY4C6G0_9TELE|nr:cyclin-dependent kinase 4 inhibitor C [Denticeps clupeoides]